MIGQTIAHYRVTAKLGQGGMGAVYRATDTKLDREVAIKVLPEIFSQDADRLVRFEREAKALAAVNHPSIAGIYGLEKSGGSQALVLELVEGEDLSERLKRGSLPVDEALEVCRQIAEALEAAHGKGIIHRDLKPGNIKLLPDGRVKVLDFGLAKVIADTPSTAQASTALTDSPTVFTQGQATMPGVLLGTAGYMSPEQARGKTVDKRSDIWSFGLILFECLTGQRIFHGETVTDSIGAVLHKEIDWSRLPAETPPTIQLLLRKCLARDRKRRLHDMADARIDIEQAVADPSSSFIRLGKGALHETSRRRGSRALKYARLVFAFVALVAITWLLKPQPHVAPAPPVHAELVLPVQAVSYFSLWPDGSNLVFDRKDVPENLIRMRRLASGLGGFTEIEIPDNCWITFYSPEGKSVAYITETAEIWRKDLDGSKPVRIVDSPREYSGRFRPGGSWSESGAIVYPDGWNDCLMQVPYVGGTGTPLTRLKEDESWHRWPVCLPGGTHVLFMVMPKREDPSGQPAGKIAIADLATGTHQILPLDGECNYVRYAESEPRSGSGHLLYVNNSGTLFAVPFSPDSMSVTGGRKDVLQGIALADHGRAFYDISRNGTLVYTASVDGESSYTNRLGWLDPGGGITNIANLEGDVSIAGLELSPDDKSVALDLTDEESDRRDVWILDLEQNLRIRFTTNEAEDGAPFWSADGAWIYFMSDRDGRPRLWKKRAGSPDSDPEPVMEHEEKMFYPNSLSGDGRHLTYSLPDPSWDIWAVELDQADPVKRLLKGTSAQEGWNAVSPDGKWLAYTSNRSGRMELYLAPFDDPDNWQKAVSRSGSTTVKWDSTGDRLFYSDPTDQLERRIWSVDISVVNGAVTLDEPREFVTLPGNAWIWDLDSAGERVLFVARERSGNGSEAMGADGEHCVVHVVSNFFTVLNQKAPAGTN